MNKENINEFKNFKQNFFQIMDFLKQYLGIVSTGIIFISFILGAWILTQYYIFNVHFTPDFSKDLIILNVFSTAWVGFIFISFFVIVYVMPLFFFKAIFKNIYNIKTWQSTCFVFFPMILSGIGAFLIIYFLDNITNFFPNLKSLIHAIAPLLPIIIATLFLFGVKKILEKEFVLKIILFFYILCILFFNFCFIIIFFKVEEFFISIFACIVYYLTVFIMYFSIYKKYNFFKILLTNSILAFILVLIMLNPYIVKISKVGNYNQSFMLYNKTEIKELLDFNHIPIFQENNATLIVKDLHILSSIGESYLIKNDENNTFSLDKKSVFNILNTKDSNKIK
ncbi:hypothetical protein DSE64_01710 [Campylobacter lari]|nr:hypothetical protein [Campylobacter lari]